MQDATPSAIRSAGPASLETRLEEAARYALLRRLTPALRHHMIGALQPLGMLAAMLERRSQAPAPDMASITKKSNEMGVLSREATAACVGLVAWITPKTADAVSIADGVKDCLGVLETDLALRGFIAVNEATEATALVARAIMRNVYAAALLAITDAAPGPAEVIMQSRQEGDTQIVSITLKPREAEPMGIGGPSYRALDWEDVEALAKAEGVVLEHSATGAVLRIAP
ncbi:MAG: hypothetical protein EON92_00260 [Burkholderiales bacterium]|nr:MAG: hypothetical protein EON92_00260 [Burkholderiales bacterium]